MRVHRAYSKELHRASPCGIQGQLMVVFCLEAETCRYLDFSSHVQFLYLSLHLFRWNIFFLMFICKYILLCRGNEFYTWSNFIWSTNCEACRNYCKQLWVTPPWPVRPLGKTFWPQEQRIVPTKECILSNLL